MRRVSPLGVRARRSSSRSRFIAAADGSSHRFRHWRGPFFVSLSILCAGYRVVSAIDCFNCVCEISAFFWLTKTVGEAIAGTGSPGEALGAGVRAFFAFLDSDRAAWAVLFDETLPVGGEVADRVAAYRGQIVELVSSSLLAQVPEGRRDATRVEIEALSTALLGAAEELARWWLRTEAISAGEAAELLISTVEPGIRARSQAAANSPTSPKPGKGPSKR